jgi:TPP-dependent pyruvate/acetoin dehydrogenase alpha subunit
MAREYIVAEGLADETTLDSIKAEVDAIVEAWITFALESPPPDSAKAIADVYVGWEVEAR